MSFTRPLTNPLSPIGRRLTAIMWWIEHAFERSRASEKLTDDTRLRIFFVLALFGAAFLTLALGATRAALFSGFGSGSRETAVPANARADLTDRDGRLLALDLTHYGLYIDPRELDGKTETRAAILRILPSLTPARLDHALNGNRREFVVGGLTPDLRRSLHDLALPGISFEEESGRAYPLGTTGAHLIGYASSDGTGLAGAERALNAEIRAGAEQGRPVALSIDLRVQAALQDEVTRAAQTFGAIGAVGIVANARTGEILGLVSYPDFDPNNAGTANPDALVNRAAARVFEPGSIMKVFTLAMGLDSGVATINTPFDARTPLAMSGRAIRDYEDDKAVLPLWQVFIKSSNIGSARLGLLAGRTRMQHYFQSFGLFDAAPSEFAESARPIVNRRMDDNTVASMSFGHAISVSPLAIATGMCAILNGGIYRPLTLHPLAPGAAPAPGRRVISAATSRTMLNLMRLNVTNGTGGKADVPGLRIGGKTGSAEKPAAGGYARNRLISSFAAVFPTDGPIDGDRYFVLIMMDEPHATAETFGFATGGWTAAPAAGRVIDRIAPFVGVRRVPSPTDGQPRAPIDPSRLTGGEGE